jgi:tetratricopeptide (TPR) repeat protein
VTTDRLYLPDAPATLAAELAAGGAIAWSEPVTIATYETAEPDRYPLFLDRRVYQGSSGRVYPIPFVDRIEPESRPRLWQAIHLENRWLRLMVLPELGGRIHVGYDKTAGYDFFYRNNVIKPALVGLAGPWISGGVEFNWPQHHRPATFLPVDTAIEKGPHGCVTVWCSDHDPFERMKGMHGIRLRPDRAAVEVVVRLHNRTSLAQTFLWWANAAAHVHEDYQSFFPADVCFVADHARRAITAFPAADRPYYGVDYPARAASGGDRLDFYRNIPVPTSYMVCDTRGDFFGGYDHRAGAGFVYVADRRIAPGKKQWTWGNAPFGQAWDRLLTDADGPYIELMAGVYTDNQPDFAWLEPGETKSFTQTWYPIQRIGPVHEATTEVALRLEVTDAEIRLGLCVAAPRAGARILVSSRGRAVLDEVADLVPGRPYLKSIAAYRVAAAEVEVSVVHDGADLLRWRPSTPSLGTQPWVATEPAAPEKVETVEELYLTGVHLAQYRHPTRSPLPYWREALRRDPGEARSNLALAEDAYRRAHYAAAEQHARRALARLTIRNANPRDGEVSYLLGLVLARTGRDDEAYDAFAKAGWDGRWLAPAMVELARLDARAGRWAAALEHIEVALRARPGDSRAHAVRVLVLRALGRLAEAQAHLADRLAADPLDQVALALADRPGTRDPRTLVDVALELAAAAPGLSLEILDRAAALPVTAAGNVVPMAHYHRAAILDRLAQRELAREARAAARAADPSLCFPSGLDDHDALRSALGADPTDGRAAALLGMLLMDRGRAAEALLLWEQAIAGGLRDPVALRNAAIAVYHLRGDSTQALQWYSAALEIDPSGRLLYERDQLLARTGTEGAQRLRLLDRQRETVLRRDDLTVEYCRLLVTAGRARQALAILESRPFAPWEGGEGLTIAAWEQATSALSNLARARGDVHEAAMYAQRAIDLPENLGEARHPLADTRALYEQLAVLLDELGQPDQAERARAAATTGSTRPAAALTDDGVVDYFATSVPDMLLFSRQD